jgi:hypothetical protein
LRVSLQRYRDYRAALADSYRLFLPTVPQPEYHLVHIEQVRGDFRQKVNLQKPGKLLYKPVNGGFELVGAVLSAQPDATAAELDARVPLSVARWHTYVNVCLPKGVTLYDVLMGRIGQDRHDLPGLLPASDPNAAELNGKYGFLADGRFFQTGSIAEDKSCREAGGYFLAQTWGWMVHVYPFGQDDLLAAFAPPPQRKLSPPSQPQNAAAAQR